MAKKGWREGEEPRWSLGKGKGQRANEVKDGGRGRRGGKLSWKQSGKKRGNKKLEEGALNLRKRRKERTNGRDEGLRLAWRKDRGTHLRASPSLRVCLWPISTSVLRGEKVLKQLPGSKRSRGEGLAAATLPQASGEEEPKLVRVVERDRYVNKPLFLSSFFRNVILLSFVSLSICLRESTFWRMAPPFPLSRKRRKKERRRGYFGPFLFLEGVAAEIVCKTYFFLRKWRERKGERKGDVVMKVSPSFRSFVRSSTSSTSSAVKRVSRQQFATRERGGGEGELSLEGDVY